MASAWRGFAVACVEGFGRRSVGSLGSGTFRGRGIERDPLDCACEDR
jgi:hypothetical protein